jgi:hypothetical protein
MTTSDQETSAGHTHLIRWIMAGVFVWGAFLALGAYLFGGNLPALRGVIIGGVVLAFLGFWLAALAFRQQRLARSRTSSDELRP